MMNESLTCFQDIKVTRNLTHSEFKKINLRIKK